MRTVLWASLRLHARRYVAAFVAVALAVAFVVVTDALASATRNGLSAQVRGAYPGADLVVGREFETTPADIARADAVARRHGDRTAVIASAGLAVRLADGRSLGDQVGVGTVATDASLRRQHVVAGRAPRAGDEALMDRSTAQTDGVQVGDRLTLGAGDQQRTVTVTGLAGPTSYLGAEVYVPWPTLARLPGVYADAVVYDVAGAGGDSATVTERRRELTTAGLDVSARADYVAAKVVEINRGVDVVSYLLLLFAAIAAFVSVLVIANTFTISFAQRARDFALLRCVGAGRRQLLASVRAESLALALTASAAGLVGGALLGHLAAWVVRGFAGPERIGAVELSGTWMTAAFVGGVVTTLVAAWWPTRAVVRVTPMAALRPQEPTGVGDRAGRVRIGLGVGLLVAGTAVMAMAASGHQLPLLILGGFASFVAVLVLGPVIVPALLRLVSAVLAAVLGAVLPGHAGSAVRIAASNAVRNPRRSAATTASLLVGVTLTCAVLTGMASARGAVEGELDAQAPVDLALVGTRPVEPATLRQVRATGGVEEATTVTGATVSAAGLGKLPLLAPTREVRATTRTPGALRVRAGEVLVPPSAVRSVTGDLPSRLRVTVDGRTTTLTARYTGVDWGRGLIVSPAQLERLGARGVPMAVWARADDGADADALGGDLGALGRQQGLELTNALEDRAYVQLQLDVLVWAVLGLLGVAVAIALVGIANTVGLSVLERSREHALLRALGLTRRQLRRVLAAEGLLLALVAGGLGTLLGAAYGWLGTLTVVRAVVADAPLVMPWTQLAAVTAVAALAGLVACVLPARRAARVTPAAGLTVD